MNRSIGLLILVIIGQCCFSSIQAAESKKKSCNDEEVDNYVSRIMTFGLDDRRYPETKAEFKEYCKEQLKLIAKVEAFKNNCTTGRTKQAVSVMLYSIKQLITSYCKNSNSKRANSLIDSAKCANAASKDYNQCNLRYIDQLLGVLSVKDNSKQLLSQLCCGYYSVLSCIREMAQPHKICTAEKIEKNTQYIRGHFDNVIDVLCSDYGENSDKCDKVKPIPLKNKSVKRPKSFFNPARDVVSLI